MRIPSLAAVVTLSLTYTLLGCTAPTPPAADKVATADRTAAAAPSTQAPTPPAATGDTPAAEAEGGEMPDGFVQLPGEPSREDPRYVITEDVCAQFTPRFISGLLGRSVDRVDSSSGGDSYTCTYYLEPAGDNGAGPFVSLTLRYGSIESQRKGHEVLGRTVQSEASIPMENVVVLQENGLINEIYLVLTPSKYVSINRSSGESLSEAELLSFAALLGAKLADMQ